MMAVKDRNWEYFDYSKMCEAFIKLGNNIADERSPQRGEIRSSNEERISAVLGRLTRFECSNLVRYSTGWLREVNDLGCQEHAALTRGLAVAENTLCGGHSGSVGAILVVYRDYKRRYPDDAEELGSWLAHHSQNHYVLAETPQMIRISLVLEEKKREEVRILREEKKKVKAAQSETLRALHEHKTKARKDLLNEIAQMNLQDRIIHIATDDERELPFYPADLISGSYDQLDHTGHSALTRIAEKAKKIPRGPWKKWLTYLRESNN